MARVFNQSNNRFNQNVVFTDPAVTGPITVTASGVISESFAGSALRLEGGAYTVAVNGLVTGFGATSYGLELGVPVVGNPSQVSAVTVGATGEIHGTVVGLAAFHAVNLINDGEITGAGGIYVQGGGTDFQILNRAAIDADPTGYAIWTDGAGTHTITNSATGTITGRIEGSFTDPSVEVITNAGVLNGAIYARGGADQVVNSGRIEGHVYLDEGDDSLTNLGTITGDINGWTGIDTITNSGRVTGSVMSGDQNDILANTGTIDGFVMAGTGNDSFTNTGGSVTQWIFMGEGRDTLTGGAGRDMVADEEGNDRYFLEDGVDNYDAVGAGTATGTDRIYGGSQTGTDPAAGVYGDEYNASDATLAVVVNLNATAATDIATGLVHSGGQASGAETGADLITGFEVVYTGAGNDVVFGNADANFVSGGDGADHLYGGGAGDYLAGGAGADVLGGGAGRDTLDMGADSDLDTVLYTALADSRPARGGRDLLLNFTDADRIDFGNLVVPGGTADHYVGTDVAFDAVAGAVRVVTTALGWLVQLDSNGDLAADLVIEISDAAHAGVIDWSDQFLF